MPCGQDRSVWRLPVLPFNGPWTRTANLPKPALEQGEADWPARLVVEQHVRCCCCLRFAGFWCAAASEIPTCLLPPSYQNDLKQGGEGHGRTVNPTHR